MHTADQRTLLAGAVGLLGGVLSATIDWFELYPLNANVDVVAHFGGGLFVAAIAVFALRGRLSGRWLAAAVSIATLAVGLGWEAVEIVSPWHSGYFVLGADDTQGDVLAVWAASFVILWLRRRYR